MNFDGSFRRLPDFDVSRIKGLVSQLTAEHWGENQARQERYLAHKHTRTISLISDEGSEVSIPKKQPAYDLFAPLVMPLFMMIANYYKNAPDIQSKLGLDATGYFVRINLVNLIASGDILKHRDKGFWLSHTHRVHVPIITNDQVFFSVGNETINMKEGQVFEINNRRGHSVVNNGTEDRIHLILDWVFPEERCCCSEHTHPDVACSPEACFETDNAPGPCDCYPW